MFDIINIDKEDIYNPFEKYERQPKELPTEKNEDSKNHNWDTQLDKNIQ